MKVLGSAVPRRVVHEAGVRSGLTGRRYELYAQRAARARAVVEAPPLGPPAAVPAVAAARTHEQAQRLLAGEVEVFGRTVPLDLEHGPGGDWHRDPTTDARWPSDLPWWRIDVRGPDRVGDVKWTWEAARHRHLVVLARAAHLAPDDRRLAGALDAGFRGWADAVPLERSVHWLSNLELAVRSLAWLQCLALAPHALGERTRRRVEAELRVVATHLRLDLRRTRHSMANNHLVGDLVGLAALQTALGQDRASTDRLLAEHVEHEVRDDGSMVEESLSYHRFVLDLLALRVLVGGAPLEVLEALERGAQWLVRLGVLEGEVPQHGDWDEGRTLVSTASVHDLRGTALLGLALAGSGAPEAWRAEHDELAWHAGPGTPVEPAPAETGGGDVGGGTSRTVAGPWTTWLRASAGGWHGHADHTALVVQHEGRTLLGDPGTGAYNGPLDERTWFRGSAAHDVLVLDGEDQLEPHRQFRWRHRARALLGPAIDLDGGVVTWAVHDAYRRLDAPQWVGRVVWTGPEGVVVHDWVDDSAGTRWSLALPLHPDVTWTDGRLLLRDGPSLHLHLPAGATVAQHEGEEQPIDGWWSATYGTRRPSTRLEVAGRFADSPPAETKPKLVRADTLVWGTTSGPELPPFDWELEVGGHGAVLRHRRAVVGEVAWP